MALLEINLRQPALLEEVVEEDAERSTVGRTSRTMKPTERGRRGGGSMLRKLAMASAVMALVAVVRAMRSRRSSGARESEGIEVPIEDGSSNTSGGGRSRRLRVLGMVLAIAGAVAAVRRMQGRRGGRR